MRGAIKYFIQHPTLVNLGVLLIVCIGLLKLVHTQNTSFPKQKVRFIDINIPYPGATPSEVEEGVTIKVEDNLEGIEGIDRVTSSSKENLAYIEVELEEEADANQLLIEVKNAVDQINSFPKEIEPASISKREPLDMTISMALSGKVPLQTRKDYAEAIKDELLIHDGLSQVFIEGVPDEEIEIRVRENDLRAYQLSIEDVRAAIANSNLETFGGNIETGNENINIKAGNKGYFGKDLNSIIVRADPDGKVVYLRDVADIKDQFEDSPAQRYLQNERVVVINTYSLASEDILENAEFVRDYMETFNATHEGLELNVLEDGTVNLKSRLKAMIDNGIVGIILVLVVLALFLDRYLAWWVAFKIPVAIIGMFVMIDIYDATINVVSLFGFILVLGILVDDGVVIGENIYQHAKEKGKNPLKAALDGTLEMVTPVMISLTTTAVAFSLFLFLPTQAGEFFGEIAFVVIAVLFVALIESFFVLPAHLAHSRGLKKEVRLTKVERWFTHSMDWLRSRVYLPFFEKNVLGKGYLKLVTVLVFIGLLAGSIAMVGSGVVNFTFFPNLDDDAIFIELELPPGTSAAITKSKLQRIEEATWEVNERYSSLRTDGQQVVRFVEQIMGPLDNQGEIKVTFLNGELRGISSFQLSQDIREAALEIPEATRLIYGLGATTSLFGLPVSFALKSKDLEELRKAKNELKEGMRQMSEVKDVSDNDMEGIRELRVKLKPQAELLGLNLAFVMAQVRSGFFGVEAQSLQREDNEVEIWVRYPLEGRNSPEQLMDMYIRTPQGNEYPFRDIAYLEEGVGNLTINHLDGRREIRVEANVASINVSAPKAIAAVEANVLPDILKKYPSVSYSVEGQNRMSFKLMGAISFVGPIILIFILGLIVVNCNSFSQAVLVFALFPFALIGVITGHWVHGVALSIFSLIGTIALIGVFVNNALVFISTLNDLLKAGMGFAEAMRETARSRFRPILLTSITTIAGLGPLIFSGSLSAQFLKGPAIAIAYGLGFGIFNVLVLLPVILMVTNKLRLFWYNRLRRGALSPAEAEPAVRKLKYLINE